MGVVLHELGRPHEAATACRLAIARAQPVGGFTGWRPLMPVMQYAVTKP